MELIANFWEMLALDKVLHYSGKKSGYHLGEETGPLFFKFEYTEKVWPLFENDRLVLSIRYENYFENTCQYKQPYDLKVTATDGLDAVAAYIPGDWETKLLSLRPQIEKLVQDHLKGMEELRAKMNAKQKQEHDEEKRKKFGLP